MLPQVEEMLIEGRFVMHEGGTHIPMVFRVTSEDGGLKVSVCSCRKLTLKEASIALKESFTKAVAHKVHTSVSAVAYGPVGTPDLN